MLAPEDAQKIMADARIDLGGNIEGQFSPEDWAKILARAEDLLRHSDQEPHEAWVEIIRKFHREKYWGFIPNYKKPKVRREEENLGKRFIWYSFRSFLLTKIAILYFGARYAVDPESIYKWLFFGAVAFMVCSYGFFLYRYGNRDEK